MWQAGKQQGIGKDEIFVLNVDRGNLMQPRRPSCEVITIFVSYARIISEKQILLVLARHL